MAQHPIVSRIEALIEHHGLTAAQLAERLGVQRSSISHLLSGRNKPSLDFILKLSSAYPDLNLYWLLSGTPPMHRTTAQATTAARAAEKGVSASAEPVIEQIIIFYADGSCKRYLPTFASK